MDSKVNAGRADEQGKTCARPNKRCPRNGRAGARNLKSEGRDSRRGSNGKTERSDRTGEYPDYTTPDAETLWGVPLNQTATSPGSGCALGVITHRAFACSAEAPRVPSSRLMTRLGVSFFCRGR